MKSDISFSVFGGSVLDTTTSLPYTLQNLNGNETILFAFIVIFPKLLRFSCTDRGRLDRTDCLTKVTYESIGIWFRRP